MAERASRRITVRNFRASDNEFDGLAGYLTEESIFSDLYLHENLAAGLSFDLDFQGNIVSNAVITNNGSVGIFMVDAYNNLFTNIQLHNSGQHGIFLAQNGTDMTSGASGTHLPISSFPVSVRMAGVLMERSPLLFVSITSPPRIIY